MQSDNSKPVKSTGPRTARTARRDRLAAADKQLKVEQERASGWEALAFEALRDDLAELALLRFDRASQLRDGVDRGEHIETDGGTDRCVGDTERYGIVHDDGERSIVQERWRLDADDTIRLRESELRALLDYERALTVSEMGRDTLVEMIPDDHSIDTDTDRSEADR